MTRRAVKADEGFRARAQGGVVRLLDEVGEDGMSILTQMDTDEVLRREIGQVLIHHAYHSGPIPPSIARRVMGKESFWGRDEWEDVFGPDALGVPAPLEPSFPWGADILDGPCPFNRGRAIRETHFAFLGLERLCGQPLTILRWQALQPRSAELRFRDYAPKAWYGRESFATEAVCGLRWYLVLKDSTLRYRRFEEQRGVLPPGYEVAPAIVEVTKNLLYCRTTGVRLNPGMWSRCSDKASGGSYVVVGKFLECGLDLDHPWNDSYSDIGVAVSRTPPT